MHSLFLTRLYTFSLNSAASLVEIFHPARVGIISNFSSPHCPVVLLMVRSPAELVVEEHWDDTTAGVFHEVGECGLEVVSIGELECMPPLHSSIKDETSLGRVGLGVILLPDVLSLEGSPQDSAPFLQQGISPRGSTTNRHLL